MMRRKLIKMIPDYMGLARNFHVNPNSCDNPDHYKSYIMFDSISDQKLGNGTTHALIEFDGKTPTSMLGYITLRASSFLMDDGDGHELGDGALEISELAVDQNFERQGVGTFLVKSAIVEADELNENHLGIKYVLLCADPAAEKFYSKEALGFKRISDFYQMNTMPYENWNTGCIPMAIKLFL